MRGDFFLKQGGQSLIEVVVAIGVVVVLVTGLVVGTTSALKAGQYTRTKSQAIKYSQEGMELARQLRNDSWAAFAAKSGLWCLNKAGSWTQSAGTCAVNIDNIFTRGVTFEWIAAKSLMKVTVDVSWTDSGGSHNSPLVSYFSQWK